MVFTGEHRSLSPWQQPLEMPACTFHAHWSIGYQAWQKVFNSPSWVLPPTCFPVAETPVVNLSSKKPVISGQAAICIGEIRRDLRRFSTLHASIYQAMMEPLLSGTVWGTRDSNARNGDFLEGQRLRLHFHCRGRGFKPCSGNSRSSMPCGVARTLPPQNKKKHSEWTITTNCTIYDPRGRNKAVQRDSFLRKLKTFFWTQEACSCWVLKSIGEFP